MIRIFLSMAVAFALAACDSGSQDGVGGVSAGEAKALNEAAARLDARAGAARSGDPGLNPAAVAAARADRNRVPPPPQPAL
ncbi:MULTISPECIES: hypothetical protein [Sphingobium]|uniref:Lipoprotein n=2 Tax=Sphingobium cupriresistens TaxID=1132417 RepID=A0A0J7XW79_9SPHN|nr:MULTISPECIES: hypothetical protein [Sphingobium]KMS55849.1 hypothetical protein V473_14120 [Sphingobium cupriresistens LL01]MBJ7377999.1 hypothetical protein [Sphingobium sp.]RYM13512.1 hypothetical protein EWH12_04605 [Sphingobium cupriresistens]WCP12840.1 hypothetical protein sphantq_01245 [Sphingobium sp. AntQ-1]